VAAHWVKAIKTVVRYDLAGSYRTYQPGDWFQCNNQEMLELLALKRVQTASLQIRENFDGQSVGVRFLSSAVPPKTLGDCGMDVRRGVSYDLPWERTALWDPRINTTAESIALGLLRIDGRGEFPAWELAAMLEHKTRLAADVGTPEERARTLEVLGDLRLPVYQTGLLWVRKTPAAEEVIQLWRAEVDAGADPQHAFLRVVYTRRVLLCTLPADWIGQWLGA